MNFASAVRLARGLDTSVPVFTSCPARRPRRRGIPRLPERLPSRHPSRNVGTNPPLSSTKSDTTTTFSSPSTPRLVHSRPLPKRDLPVVKVRLHSSRSTVGSHPTLRVPLEPPIAIYRNRGIRARRLGRVRFVCDKPRAGFRCGNAPSAGNCPKAPSN